MAVLLHFEGDPSETRAQVETILRQEYETALGVHEIVLLYTAGAGYRLMSAIRELPVAKAFKSGDLFETQPSRHDITEAVIKLLQSRGVPLH